MGVGRPAGTVTVRSGGIGPLAGAGRDGAVGANRAAGADFAGVGTGAAVAAVRVMLDATSSTRGSIASTARPDAQVLEAVRAEPGGGRGLLRGGCLLPSGRYVRRRLRRRHVRGAGHGWCSRRRRRRHRRRSRRCRGRWSRKGGVGVADGAADAATTGGVGLAGADDSAASLVGARSEAACTQGGTIPSLPNPSRFPEAASGSLSSASSSGAS